MKSLIKKMYKPEYFYRPSQLLRRIQFSLQTPASSMQEIPLIWGAHMDANPRQTIGLSLYTFGLYDLALSEMIYRLVKPGDFVIDVGANVGYTSRLMLDCLGGSGTLWSFEPLPQLFKVLEKNCQKTGSGVSRTFQEALSNSDGTAELRLPDSFSGNDGVATLEKSASGQSVEVKISRLDTLNVDRKVKLMKLDVEGHELSVLLGAEKTLEKNLIENIIFEDLQGHSGPTAKFLESKGYKIYKLVKNFRGLAVSEPEHETLYSYEPDNFLATKDPALVLAANEKPSWQIFSWRV